MRVITLNVNGIRSATTKGFFDWMRRQDPDVVCLQEVRAQCEQMTLRARKPRGYHAFFACAERPGYSGVALYARRPPDRVVDRLGWRGWDGEGRYLQADFGRLSVISLYMPSGSSSELRQAAKLRFMRRLMRRLVELRADGREYIVCGDWNIAHRQIDLENWRGNQKNSGFLPEERAWLDRLFTRVGWVDGFRVVNPDPRQYTWWSNRGQAWAKNVGWRIDYQVITPSLAPMVAGASIYTKKRFSDHAPLTMDYRWEL